MLSGYNEAGLRECMVPTQVLRKESISMSLTVARGGYAAVRPWTVDTLKISRKISINKKLRQLFASLSWHSISFQWLSVHHPPPLLVLLLLSPVYRILTRMSCSSLVICKKYL